MANLFLAYHENRAILEKIACFEKAAWQSLRESQSLIKSILCSGEPADWVQYDSIGYAPLWLTYCSQAGVKQDVNLQTGARGEI